MDIGKQIEIRKRVDAATPPPWKDCPSVNGSEYRYVQIGKDERYTTLEMKPDDARFIAHAREDVDALLDALGTARAKLGQLQSDIRSFAASIRGNAPHGNAGRWARDLESLAR